ncbi:MAG: GNAT family N-acetyltransferase [Defluviitaleaceae bacterium]|nr:GNAT family N-acetyltransferase [Defluviitaleaceae bacterium]MCL2274839.1 GNAT family N-acetyltransferase [Defluviitaleaceae bacterium]
MQIIENTLQTERLTLRPFTLEDAEHMYNNWAQDPDIIRFYTHKTCETVEEVREWIINWAKYFTALEEKNWDYGSYAIVQKFDGEVIGTIDYAETDRDIRAAEVGYMLGKPWRGKGYVTEALKAVLAHCFDTVGLNRVWANFNAKNTASGKVLERAGMTYEGLRRQCTLLNGEIQDREQYAMLKADYEIQKEIAYYTSLPCNFTEFISVPTLSDGEIYLVCTQKYTNEEKKHVPSYLFAICKEGEKIGNIGLRIGYGGGEFGQNLYYGGQIGYDIEEAFRGNGYAVRACRLLVPVAKAHDMHILLITNDVNNHASRRVCEKLNAKLIRTVTLPEWTDLYKMGQRQSNIFEWKI